MWNGGPGSQARFAAAANAAAVGNYAHQGHPRLAQGYAGSGPPPPPPDASRPLDAMSWDEIYDAGHLDVHLKTQLNLGPPPRSQPPPHGQFSGHHPGRLHSGRGGPGSHPPPLMSIVARPPVDVQVPPPHLSGGGGGGGGGVGRMMMRPPGHGGPEPPAYGHGFAPMNHPPPMPLFTQPPPPIRGPSRPPVILKRPPPPPPSNGSPAPFRGSSSSAKYASRNPKIVDHPVVHAASSDTSLFDPPKAAAAAAVEVEVESDHPRTLYRPPEPKVKILKRPSSTPSNLSGQENSTSVTSSTSAIPPAITSSSETSSIQIKSLREREEEYNQARLRIFGSIDPLSAPGAETIEDTAAATTTGQSTHQPSHSINANVLRDPKGPDGTTGFKLKR